MWAGIGKKSLIFTLCFFIGTGTFNGLAGHQPDSPAVLNMSTNDGGFSVDSFNEKYMVLDLEAKNLCESNVVTEEGIFTLLTVPGMGYTTEVGSPKLPCMSLMMAVPNTILTFEILYDNYYETDVGQIYPVQEPEYDSYTSEVHEFAANEAAYSANDFYPGEVFGIVDTGFIRVIPFARICFYPVQYNPATGLARIYTQVQVKLVWDPETKLEINENQNSQYFESYYQNVFANWDAFSDTFSSELAHPQNNARSETGCEYLIITDPAFVDAANALRDWKIQLGIDTWVKETDETGTDEPELKTYIQNAYLTWVPSPSFVLFIGDSEHISPLYYNIHPYYGTYTGTDLWYFTIMGMDHFPEIFYGRIPVDNLAQATNIVNKIINYEKDPPNNAGFYNNVTVAAYFQDDEDNGYETRRFVRTSEEVRDFLRLNLTDPYEVSRVYCTDSWINPTHYNNGDYGNGEPLPLDLLRPLFLWDGNADDIINRVNWGNFILNHRDHGSRDGWGDPSFHISELSQLDNGELLPIVFSLNCETGWFDHETDGDGGTNSESFCEEFLRLDDKGAVGVFGATRVSYSGYNDFLCRGFYDAMWPEFDTTRGSSVPMYRMGEVLNYGKTYMTQTWGDPWDGEVLTFEIFHYYGDPTMQIWTAEPDDMIVSHPAEVIVETTQITVNVDQDDAFVCLLQNGEVVGSGTSVGGSVIIDVGPLTAGAIDVTVTKHNFRPYMGSISVIEGYPPLVSVTEPSGGQVLAGGGSQTISWDMGDGEDAIDELTVDLYYSTDGGMTFPNPIASGLTGFLSNPCTHIWNPLPVIDSGQVRVRAIVTDTHAMTDQDDSPADFTIDSTAPEPATNVRAELDGTGVRIYWDASPSADVDRYEVYWKMNAWDASGDTYTTYLAAGLNTDVFHANAGVNNPASYTYQVRTYDLVGHEARTTIQAAKYGSTQPGFPYHWWLLGSALVQSDTSISHVIQGFGLPSAMEYLRTYDTDTGVWHSHNPAAPSSINTMTDIYTDQGFWIRMQSGSNARYNIAGFVEDKSITLYEGWNIVAYPFAERSMTTSGIMSHLSANCPSYDDMLINGVPYGDPYHLKTPDGTETITHNMGFWVHVTADTTWTVTNY